MLDELSKHDYLGTPEYFCDVINLLKTSEIEWSKDELRHYFANKIYKYPYVDGGLEVLATAGILNTEGAHLTLTPHGSDSRTSPEGAGRLVANRLIEALAKIDELTSLFAPSAISLDYSDGALLVGLQSFPLRYRAIRSLLVDLGIIQKRDGIAGFVILAPYDMTLRNILKELSTQKKMSVEQLKASLLRQEELGSEAEDFALAYERKRLAGHSQIDKIMRISQVDVSAGYDIVSFNDMESKINNRFIEVKSYSGTPSFYWTQNEIDTARAKAKSYYLYLVDRQRMSEAQYTPLVIQDPFATVYSAEDWAKMPTVIFVTKVG